MPIDFTNREQAAFLKRLGGNAETFLFLLDTMPDTAAYLKDRKGRIMFLNEWNCANCNVKHASEAIGKTSYDLFPDSCAKDYVDTDSQVMRTGTPIVNAIASSPDMTTKFMCYSKAPLRGKDGRIIGVAAIYRLMKDAREMPEWYGSFSDVAEYINANYAKPITVSDLAMMTRSSVSRFRRGFKTFFKMSPVDYILLTRVNAGREMLEHSSRLITHIALDVGFCDHSHFIKVFKRFRGVTPHQYRLQHRRGQGKTK